MILKIFHNHNLAYSSGINFESLIDIIQKSTDPTKNDILKIINEKFMKKIKDNFISGHKNIKKGINKENENKNKEILIHKREIKCLECQKLKNKTVKDLDNNIFNSIDRDQLNKLLILPNEFEFNSSKEKEIQI